MKPPARWDPTVWEDRIAEALGDIEDLRRVHRDARAAHVLDRQLSNGQTIGVTVEGLAARLLAEQDTAPEDAA